MNKTAGVNINSNKSPLHPQNGKKMELHLGKSQPPEKSRRRSTRERKLALLQDVDNLKKKLRYEENVHRALERAFNRPLGALPRLPPYLPQHTVELLAEVAVLEEEVVRLEEQVVNFRQGLYQEAVNISSKNSAEDLLPSSSNEFSVGSSKQRHSRSLSHSEVNVGSQSTLPSPSFSRTSSIRKLLSSDTISNGTRHFFERPRNGKQINFATENRLEKENQTRPLEKRSPVIGTPAKIRHPKTQSSVKRANTMKMQYRTVEQAHECSSGSSDDKSPNVESEANKMSEEILKCLINIFVRLSSMKGKTMDFDSLGSKMSNENVDDSDFRDPYCNSCDVKKKDIGTYKHLFVVEARSIDLNQKTNASFLMRRLKILLGKLASVKLDGLSHHQKLAFWINIYNSCIMNAFLEDGIPDAAEKTAIHMQNATIKIGGHVLNALMIEHLILRLPYHLKYSKSMKNDETKVCRTFGLEWSEPLVTFALSCGSWSSPAVRVYTGSQIESELETAKRDYLQAAVGISTTNKLIVPKLLDWYILDFAKDLDALLEWLCLQLRDDLRKDAVKCLERKGKEPLSELVQVMPYNFSFRYLICR